MSTMNDLLRGLLRSIDTPYAFRRLNHARLHMIHHHGVQPMPDSLNSLKDMVDFFERHREAEYRAERGAE